MDRIRLLRIVNVLLFCVLALQAVTGLFMFFEVVTPAIALIHKYNALLLIFFVAAHIVLNWVWVRAAFLARRP